MGTLNFINEYKDYLVARNYSEHTVREYIKDVTKFVEKYSDYTETKTVDVQNYIDDLKDKPPTANRTLNAVRSYYGFLCDVKGVIGRNPADAAKGMKVETEEKGYLTVEQVKTVIDSMDGLHKNRNKLIIALMSIDCLRISEVMNIKLKDINLDEGTIYIHGKGKRNRIAYLTHGMREYLMNYLEEREQRSPECDDLFTSQDGKGKISRSTIEAFIKKAERDTGFELHPHKFRHTGATLAYESSKDLVAVQNLLGHENIESTKRYTHVSEENRRRLVENSPLNELL